MTNHIEGVSLNYLNSLNAPSLEVMREELRQAGWKFFTAGTLYDAWRSPDGTQYGTTVYPWLIMKGHAKLPWELGVPIMPNTGGVQWN